MLLVALIISILWALVMTGMLLIRNPLPFPDRGHRLFGVPDRKAQRVVLEILKAAGLPLRFRFKTGPTDQALLWDNTTVIHRLDSSANHSGNGISVPVPNPEEAAAWATTQLEAAGYSVRRIADVDKDLPTNHLIVLMRIPGHVNNRSGLM